MEDNIKKVLAKYDELAQLVLDQKMDELEDKMQEIPEDSDELSYEAYLQSLVMEETNAQTALMEDQEDELLDGMSMRDYFVGLSVDELLEIMEYCAVTLDRGMPASLIDALIEKAEISDDTYYKLINFSKSTIENAAWIEDELKDEDAIFGGRIVYGLDIVNGIREKILWPYNYISSIYSIDGLPERYNLLNDKLKLFKVYPFFRVDTEEKFSYYKMFFEKIKDNFYRNENIYSDFERTFAKNILNAESLKELQDNDNKIERILKIVDNRTELWKKQRYGKDISSNTCI